MSTPSPIRRGESVLAAACLLAALGLQPAAAQALLPDAFFIGRPAFSQPEQPGRPASCEDIAGQLPDSIPPDSRVDMAIAGAVSLIQTDGALWYIAVCAEPGMRVLCVTYSANDLKLGDKAILRGGYARQDRRHVMLDPCLASPETGNGAPER
ncbi:conserved exported hypothetical protein [Hyphomicrobiales bacterium]|nr:conserved exported hypothetical protein [Hyphomicrobiales bacterium]CAH1701898.1 conserved exported hypothetical protein [Hyphomicrobiales bacterium]CAI0346055.1 conserved exported hypothetical protein [Hyphomicrobiales bacterium]